MRRKIIDLITTGYQWMVISRKIYQHYRYVVPFATSRERQSIDSLKPMAVFSSPRGGSTWVGELLSKLPDSVFLFEPLYLHPPYAELKKVNLWWNPHIPEDAHWPEAQEYFHKLYNMQVKSLRSLRLYYHNRDLSKISKSKNFVIKDVNSNMLLPWITKNFPIRAVYVVRHPCAVIASQLEYGRWEYVKENPNMEIFPAHCRYPDFYLLYKDIFDKVRTQEQRMAADWALHNIVPLHHPDNNKRWITVSYEKLYKSYTQETDGLFRRLGETKPESVELDIRKPSLTALTSSVNSIKEGTHLEKWKKTLSSKQVNDILSIIGEFGIKSFTESPEPDYELLFQDRSFSGKQNPTVGLSTHENIMG